MRGKSALFGGAALVAFASPACAQQAVNGTPAAVPTADGTAPQNSEVGEIVVTALKQRQLLSKAPVAISVVSQDTLTRQGIDSVGSLTTTVPNLQQSANGFAIRGIGNNNGFSSYSTVATQFDGIYDPSSAALTLAMFDIGSVEVARGPQGTLYGRNATAGVVNINTADPGRKLGFTGDLQYGNFNSFRLRGALDVPLTDTLSIRLAGFRQVDGGIYGRYAANENFGKTNLTGMRVTALWKPTSKLSWRVSLNWGRNTGTIPIQFLDSVNTYPNASLAAGTFGPVSIIKQPTGTLNPGQAEVTNNHQDVTDFALRSRLVWQPTEKLSFTYLAGYSLLADNGIDSATGIFGLANQQTRTQTLSNELDINFKSGRLEISGGGLIYRDNIPSGTRVINAGDTAPAPFNALFNASGLTKYTSAGGLLSTVSGVDVIDRFEGVGDKSKALFGQAQYAILPNLKILAGLRGTWETVTSRQIETVCLGGTVTFANIADPRVCPGGLPTLSLADDSQRSGANFNNVSWKTGINYDLSRDTFLYGTIGTGFRSGGLQSSSNTPQYQQYQPETVTNYEIGVRTKALRGKLFLSLTLFNMDYKNLQVSSIIVNPSTNTNTAVTTNAATARLRGVEFETTYRPTSRDRFTGYVSFLDAKIKSYPNAADNLNSGGGTYNGLAVAAGFSALPSNVLIDASGSTMPNAPKWSGRISYAHDFDLAGGTLSPQVDFYAQSKTFSGIPNYVQGVISSYTKTDINLRYEVKGGMVSITGFANNLENSKIVVNRSPVWSSTTSLYAAPRTYGVRLGVKF